MNKHERLMARFAGLEERFDRLTDQMSAGGGGAYAGAVAATGLLPSGVQRRGAKSVRSADIRRRHAATLAEAQAQTR